MSTKSVARRWTLAWLVKATAVIAVTTACSPGTLPGSPSPLTTGGGGGRYNGQVTYRRIGVSGFTITETAQALNLSIALREAGQMSGRFESGESSGTLQGVLTGELGSGNFTATILLSSLARSSSGAATTCEGQGQAAGILAGRNLTWTVGTISYTNCPGLSTSSQAQAVAVSPIPGEFRGRANVVLTVLGGTNIRRGTCAGGTAGYPFTVEIMETSGINVTFDPTFLVEEHRNFAGAPTFTVLDMPFTELQGGNRRQYGGCSLTPGTYQAFFSGSDVNGNRVRVGSPTVTFVP